MAMGKQDFLLVLDVGDIDKAAEDILSRLESGELVDGCCMGAAPSPVTEAWDAAETLVDAGLLCGHNRQEILYCLSQETRRELESSSFDDFDRVYQRILQLIGRA
jgi:hypothetical protein